MHPILFKIGSFTFYTHGLLAVLGIIAGSLVLFYLAEKRKLDTTFIFDNVVYTVLFGIIGARITYFILYRDQFKSIWEVFQLWQGGMVSYGGFILGGIAFWFLIRSQKQSVIKWLDLIGIAFPIGLFFGRLGNIFAGEYDGIMTASKLNLGGLVPVTLYEAILVLLLFIFLWLIYRKNYSNVKSGLFFLLSLFIYGLGRFIIDFWRDEKTLLWHLSLGQYTSIILIIVAGFFSIRLFAERKDRNENDSRNVG